MKKLIVSIAALMLCMPSIVLAGGTSRGGTSSTSSTTSNTTVVTTAYDLEDYTRVDALLDITNVGSADDSLLVTWECSPSTGTDSVWVTIDTLFALDAVTATTQYSASYPDDLTGPHKTILKHSRFKVYIGSAADNSASFTWRPWFFAHGK